MTFIDFQSIDIADLLQLAIVPVFLLCGAALVLSVIDKRLAYVTDYMDVTESSTRRSSAQFEPNIAYGRPHLLARRPRHLRGAVGWSVLAALLGTLGGTLLFIDAGVSVDLFLPMALLFVGSSLCMLAALLELLIDGRCATRALRMLR